ncbi:MAG: hypothetical protein ACLFO6_09140 [Archaeoglobaceae archaeon]
MKIYTCKECSNSDIHLGYWICRAKEERKIYPLTALVLKRKEKCPDFHQEKAKVV